MPLGIVTLGLSELGIACNSGQLSVEECRRAGEQIGQGIERGGQNAAAGMRASQGTNCHTNCHPTCIGANCAPNQVACETHCD